MWTKNKYFETKRNIITESGYTLANSLNFNNKEWIRGSFRKIKKNSKSSGRDNIIVGIQMTMSRDILA